MKIKVLVLFLIGVIHCTSGQYLSDKDKFRIGVNLGLPVGDAAEITTFGLGLELNYHYGISKVFDLGLIAGYSHAFIDTEKVESNDFDNIRFFTVAGSVRVYPTVRSRINFGVDGGYAYGLDDEQEGGLYYRPLIAYNIGRGTEISVSYSGISNDDSQWDTVALGFYFLF